MRLRLSLAQSAHRVTQMITTVITSPLVLLRFQVQPRLLRRWAAEAASDIPGGAFGIVLNLYSHHNKVVLELPDFYSGKTADGRRTGYDKTRPD